MTDTQDYRIRLQSQHKARTYATRFERGSRRRTDQREQRAVRRILAGLRDVRTVLDVPCGAGRFLATLAQDRREVVEMDVAEEVLDLARQRAADLGVTAQCVHGDATCLPLPEGSVDLVFCSRLLHHIKSAPERAVFLREFQRVSRRYLVISFFDYLAFGPVRPFLKRLKGRKVDYAGQPTLRQFHEEVARCGFRVLEMVPTGPFWVAEKYLVLEKTAA